MLIGAFDYSYNYSLLPRAESVDIGYTVRPEDTIFDINLNRSSDLFSGGLDINYFKDETNHNDATHISGNINSAFVFADGQLAMSRPVSNGFAMFTPNCNVKSWDVFVNPTQDTYLSKSSTLNPAVVTNLSAYQPRHFYLEAPKIPPGFSIGKVNYRLKPKNKSGFNIPVGEDSSIMLSTTLVDQNGAPLSLKAGKVIHLDKNKEPIQFFTNKKGKLRILGLYPGKFIIKVYAPGYKEKKMIFTKDDKGVLKLERLVIPKKMDETLDCPSCNS
ncbi:MAG: hypothetical protein L7U87_04055 [Chlamydiales bacterium]|nr:hypothetical protein [Chlamydiales bacterium]